jgi:predicted regulator of Ras-like GTPase activity (Roadblock/LC7/MglB family)
MKTALGFDDSSSSIMLADMQRPNVLFSVLVWHDGLLLGSTTVADVDAEMIGIWALGIFMNSENVARKLGRERVYQLVLTTGDEALIIADLGDSLIALAIDAAHIDEIEQLLDRASTILAQRQRDERSVAIIDSGLVSSIEIDSGLVSLIDIDSGLVSLIDIDSGLVSLIDIDSGLVSSIDID